MTRDRRDGPPRGTVRRALEWLFVNRSTGRITIGQFPNRSLAVFLLAAVLAWLLPGVAASSGFAGTPASLVAIALGRTAGLVATGAISWWGLEELFFGVNPVRRLLGAVVLALVVGGAVATILG